jgi:flavodoxin I
MGILAEILEGQGAKLVGFTSTEGYRYESSRAERGDQFCGLGIDYETQGSKNKDRISYWVEKLKLELP